MVPGLLGKKIGMTHIFDEDGIRTPVTVVKVGPCQVLSVRTPAKNGYAAVQLGFDKVKEKNMKKPQREYSKKNGLDFVRFVREIRCEDDPEVKMGDVISSTIFQKGDHVDVTGTTKGKGFQGGMKRCGWSGGKESHGSMSHRVPGSIGASSYPSKVTKGHGMPGQMGTDTETVQNIEVMDVDKDNDTITVKGSLPGATGGYLVVRYALKKPLAERVVTEEPAEESEGGAGADEAKGGEGSPEEAAGKDEKTADDSKEK